MKQIFFLLICLVSEFYSFSQAQLGYAKEKVKLLDSTMKEKYVLPEGEALYLNNLEAVKGAYKVKLLKNGHEGYLKVEDLKIERELKEGDTFEVLKQKEKDPILRVHNNSRIPMSLKFAKKDYTLYPGNIVNIRIAKGKHYYYVSSSKSEYHYGHEVMEDYRLYNWEFYVDDVK